MTSPSLKFSKILATGGILILLVTFFVFSDRPDEFMRSYLFSFLFWSDIPIGAMALIMIYHLTGGTWGVISHKVLEALAKTINILAVLAMPVLVGASHIYSWANPLAAAEPKVLHKHIYLNTVSFAGRTVFYFFSWMLINNFLQKWSHGKGSDEENSATRNRLKNLSAAGLVFLGFSVSFAGIDWQMSVEPQWYSTVYGMVFAVGETLTTYALALFILSPVAKKLDLEKLLSEKALQDLGNILLILVMLWAYLSFMQYLIIWSGNLPHEVTWINRRMSQGWQYFALFLITCQFFAPFSLLLSRSTIKRNLGRLGKLGFIIFFVRIFDHYWMLVPGFSYVPLKIFVSSLLCWFGLGAIWTSVFLRKLNASVSI
jgi:hypothetical protein